MSEDFFGIGGFIGQAISWQQAPNNNQAKNPTLQIQY